MKKLTIEEKAKRYDEAIENGKQILNTPYTAHWNTMKEVVEHLLPELKENEDERIRKAILEHIQFCTESIPDRDKFIAWLEKQGQTFTKKDVDDAYLKGVCDTKHEFEKQGAPTKLSEEEQNKFAKGVLTSCALSFINYLDAHKYEGKMCVSNGECEDIENAFHNAIWDKLHRYYCKYIEKQSEKPQGKSALEAAKEEKVDNQNCVKPANKIEPKFKVGDKIQYKNYTYTIKDVQEDCYVLDNDKVLTFNAQDVWELVKHNPTEKKPTESEDEPTAWSEDDEEMFKYAIGHFEIQKRNSIEGGLRKKSMQEFIDWIKSLKDRLV